MSPRFILASASPQRRTLLQGIGVEFDVIPSGIDESSCGEREPGARAKKLAFLKAADIAKKHPSRWVIGCDTLVVSANGEMLEKPRDAEEANMMLLLQSGKTSIVHSGLSVIDPKGRHFEGLSSSEVRFAQLTDDTIRWWIESGFWKDRSGGFQIDGQGQLLIAEIRGDWTSIVGFPVFLFGQLCKEAGLTLMG